MIFHTAVLLFALTLILHALGLYGAAQVALVSTAVLGALLAVWYANHIRRIH